MVKKIKLEQWENQAWHSDQGWKDKKIRFKKVKNTPERREKNNQETVLKSGSKLWENQVLKAGKIKLELAEKITPETTFEISLTCRWG